MMNRFMRMIRGLFCQKTFSGCFAVLAVLFSGCDKDPAPTPETPENNYREINSWILENMQTYYFWNTQIPRTTDKTLFPGDYFETLLYSGDKYSWIQENFIELMKQLSGVVTEAGYDFNLFALNDADVLGYITYIKKGSPAEAAGLKRGDIFESINNAKMTMTNYSEKLQQTLEQHTLGLIGGKNISLSVVEYEENPILMDTVYTIQNKKIGYFVYNFFARGAGDESIAYEKELNALFGKFKTEAIDELIIDLRYNSGGAVITATALASMISGRTASDVFITSEYNSLLHSAFLEMEGSDYNKTFFLDYIERYVENKKEPVEQVAVEKLEGLDRLYAIVTGRSASASELLINGLKPYMDVVLAGDRTEGKNLASITIYEEDAEKQKTNTWGMQPIVLRTANSEGFSDYADGFAPDVESYEFTQEEFDAGEMLPIGDTDEPMLKAALDHMLGRAPSSVRKSAGKSLLPVGSAGDRIPARKNMYIAPGASR